MTSFVEFEIETNEDELLDQHRENMSAAFPGWGAPAGSYEDWLAREWIRISVEVVELAADVPAEIFYKFGEAIVDLPPIDASPAIATSTWTVQDTAGYTIPAGTLVSIAKTGSEVYGFAVREDVIIDPGDTSGSVVLEAVEPGSLPNGANLSAQLIDAITYVTNIELDTAAADGTDAEDPDNYLDRLAAELRLLTPRPILPSDAATLARRIPGVERALALDLYDPNTETWDNGRTVTVALVDELGAPVSGPTASAVQVMLEAMREINFVFYTIEPTYNGVDVEYGVTAAPGFDLATVEASVADAIDAYLNPATWGADDSGEWSQLDHVYVNELIALADRVTGVDRVTSMKVALTGDALGTVDIELDGPAPLPYAGDITVAP